MKHNHPERFYVTDLDGTILASGEDKLKRAFLDMIPELNKKGHQFAVASGRSYPELKKFFASVLFDMYFICENGALVMYRGKVLQSNPLPFDTVDKLMTVLEMRNLEWAAAGVHTIYTKGTSKEIPNYYKKQGLSIMKVKSFKEIPEPLLRISVWCEGVSQDSLKNELETLAGGKVQAVYENCIWLDFVAAGVNKGAALLRLGSECSLSREQIIAFGDNWNDVEMFDAAGTSYAMDWAPEDVKQYATNTTSCVLKTIKTT